MAFHFAIFLEGPAISTINVQSSKMMGPNIGYSITRLDIQPIRRVTILVPSLTLN